MTAPWHPSRARGWQGSACYRVLEGHPAFHSFPSTRDAILWTLYMTGTGGGLGYREGDMYVAHDGAAYAWVPPPTFRVYAVENAAHVEADGLCPILAGYIRPESSAVAFVNAVKRYGAGLSVLEALEIRDRGASRERHAAFPRDFVPPSRKSKRRHAKWAAAFKARIVARLGWDPRAQWRRRA